MPIKRLFGGWIKAIKVAGLEPYHQYGVPNEELYREYIDIYKDIGHIPNYGELLRANRKYDISMYERRHKRLKNFRKYAQQWALKQGNIDPSKLKN